MEVAADRWDALLGELGVTDVYYQRGYVRASARLGGGEPVLLHLGGDGGDVVFALLLRSDPADVVTPYGYGGPVAVGAAPPVAAFRDAYAAWCASRGAVSTLVTYHPLFANQRLAEPTGFRTRPLAGTVAWSLAPGDLVARMHKHHRRLVRRAEREGLEVAVAPSPRELGAFVSLYEATMRRAGAADFYLFSDAYWQSLVADVPLVRVDVHDPQGELAASVLGIGRPPWLHYHLGGSTDAGRRLGASQLALLGLARWGREQGYELLHLGGGVGGGEDSLFSFKARFDPDGRREIAIGMAVHDREAYARLSGQAEPDYGGFFPGYRATR